jgi:hypothetical protein
MLTTTLKITGPARRTYTGDDTDGLRGQLVTTTHREAQNKFPSPASPPIPCRLPDGSPCWVQPVHLGQP